MLEENVKHRSLLKEKTYELEAMTSKYRKIQSMLQSGQYLQAINTTAVSSSNTNQAGVMLVPSATPIVGTSTMLLTSRSPTREHVSFSILKDEAHQMPINVTGGTKARPELQLPKNSALICNAQPDIQNPSSMSNMTQITTANTTSSTNNTTELLTDYSSARLISTATSTVGTTNSNQLISESIGDQILQTQAGNKQFPKHKIVGPTSYDHYSRNLSSTTVLNKNSRDIDRQQMQQSCDDLKLFTVLSYLQGGFLSGDKRNNLRKSQEITATTKGNKKLGQWLEGPFCTVRLRGHDSDQNHPSFYARQASQPHETPSKPQGQMNTTLVGACRGHLPRTLSMIEYLGLNEYDLIARRHEKILKYQRHQKIKCCCGGINSCSYCSLHNFSLTNSTRPRYLCSSREVKSSHDDNSNTTSSEFDVFTHSSISCSTCCSLVSGANSELLAGGSQTQTSGSSTSHDDLSSPFSQSTSDNAIQRFISESQSSTQSGSFDLIPASSGGGASGGSSTLHQHHHTFGLNQVHHHVPCIHSDQIHHHFTGSLSKHILVSHDHIHHPCHHQSTGGISTASSSTNTASNRMQSQSSTSAPQKHSMYTSGVVYVPACSDEAANEAAQVVGTNLSIRGEDTDNGENSAHGDINPTTSASTSLTIEESNLIPGDEVETSKEKEILIKCDVLESL